jgi:hypothetical protein
VAPALHKNVPLCKQGAPHPRPSHNCCCCSPARVKANVSARHAAFTTVKPSNLKGLVADVVKQDHDGRICGTASSCCHCSAPNTNQCPSPASYHPYHVLLHITHDVRSSCSSSSQCRSSSSTPTTIPYGASACVRLQPHKHRWQLPSTCPAAAANSSTCTNNTCNTNTLPIPTATAVSNQRMAAAFNGLPSGAATAMQYHQLLHPTVPYISYRYISYSCQWHPEVHPQQRLQHG